MTRWQFIPTAGIGASRSPCHLPSSHEDKIWENEDPLDVVLPYLLVGLSYERREQTISKLKSPPPTLSLGPTKEMEQLWSLIELRSPPPPKTGSLSE